MYLSWKEMTFKDDSIHVWRKLRRSSELSIQTDEMGSDEKKIIEGPAGSFNAQRLAAHDVLVQ